MPNRAGLVCLSVFSVLAATAFVPGCEGAPDVTGARQSVMGPIMPDPNQSGIALATVGLTVGAGSCSGTLIAQQWVLTAAHCVGGLSPAGIGVTEVGIARVADACFIHPLALPAGTPRLVDCPSAPPDTGRNYGVPHDLALVHLSMPITTVGARTIGPPRINTPRSGQGPAFDTFFRGFGPGSGGGFQLGLVANRAMTENGTFLNTVTTLPMGIVSGDSGGTFSVESSDAIGPVIAVESNGTTTIDNASMIWGTDTSVPGPDQNLAWIWSVLDPGSGCTFRSTSGCAFHDPAPGADRCGDALCGPTETPASCDADCFPLPDSDGDGLPDIRDICPHISLVGARTDPTGMQHLDSDNDFMGDDCEVVTTGDCGAGVRCDCSELPGFDSDYDGWQDECDNCPLVFNPDQVDCDHNQVGDRCDTDRDRDSVTDACDNCPPPPGHPLDGYNPSQENCNIDAELAATFCDPQTMAPCPAAATRALGDVCDPIPCARTEVDVTREHATGTLDVYAVPDRITLQPIVGGPRVGGPTDTDAFTDFRYCRCAAANVARSDTITVRQTCERGFGCRIARTGEAAALFDTVEDLMAPPVWRHTTTFRTDIAPIVRLPITYSRLGLGPVPRFFPSPYEYEWDLWPLDVPRWAGIYTTDPGPTQTEAVPGVLWTHSARDVTDATDRSTRSLRSHYRSGPMSPQLLLQLELVCPLDGFIPTPCVALPAPSCPASQPLCFPYGRWPWVFLSRPGQPHFLSFQYSDFGAVPAGAAFPSQPPFAATDLAWTALAEPVELLRPEQTLRYVGISPDGARVASVLHATAFGYAPRDFAPSCSATDPKCFPSLVFAPTDPLFVLSASRGQLFVVTSGASAIDLESGARRTLDVSGLAFGTLLAATYEMFADRLYVLDEVTLPRDRDDDHAHAAAAVARLTAIDPAGAGATVLATWPRRTTNTRFALGAAGDGRLYLAASGSGRHVLVRVSIDEAEEHQAGAHEVRLHRIGAGEGAVGSTMVYAGRFDVGFAVDHPTSVEVRHYPISAPLDEDDHDASEGDGEHHRPRVEHIDAESDDATEVF